MAMQAEEPEFRFPAPTKKMGTVMCACTSGGGGGGAGRREEAGRWLVLP